MVLNPVRCFTCGKVLPQSIYDSYHQKTDQVAIADPQDMNDMRRYNDELKAILDSLDLKRYCCRMVVMTSIDFSEQLMAYCNTK